MAAGFDVPAVAQSEAVSEPASGERPSLIAAVGHRYCKDLSAGPVWLDHLQDLAWPPGVLVEDFSFGAVAMMQRLEAAPCGRVLFLSAELRDREPGSIHLSRYRRGELDPELVQASVSEAGAGVVAVELLLEICDYFQVLPEETYVLEVEPVDGSWGEEMSPEVEALFPQVLATAQRFAGGDTLLELDQTSARIQ